MSWSLGERVRSRVFRCDTRDASPKAAAASNINLHYHDCQIFLSPAETCNTAGLYSEPGAAPKTRPPRPRVPCLVGGGWGAEASAGSRGRY